MAKKPEGPPWPKGSREQDEGQADGRPEDAPTTPPTESVEEGPVPPPGMEPAPFKAVLSNFGTDAPLGTEGAKKPKHRRPLAKKLQRRGAGKGSEEAEDILAAPESLAALNTSTEPFTPKESKEDLQNLRERLGIAKKEKNEEVVAQNAEFALAEANAKEKYFTALRKYQRSRSIADVASERVGLKTGNVADGGELLQGMKTKWIEARVALAKSKLASIEERREGRGELQVEPKGMKAHSRKDRDIALVQERYTDRYLRKDIAFGIVAEEQAARMDALKTRDRNIIEKGVNAYLNLSPEKRMAVSGALLGTAAFGAGTALVAGSAAAVLTLVVLASSARGMALNWKAADLRKKAEEINRNLSVPVKGHAYESWKEQTALRDEKLRQADALSKKATPTSFAAIGSWLAAKITRGFQKNLRNEAQSTLSESASVDITDAEAVTRSVYESGRAHAELRKADAQVGAASFAAGSATSFGAGVAIGAGVHYGGEAVHDFVSDRWGTDGDTASTEAASSTPAAPEGMVREISIGKGEGFNNLFTGLRESGFNGSTAVGNYLDNTDVSATQLSEAIGAYDPITGESMPMQVGDKLLVDAHENVWFVREGAAPQLILENDPSQASGFSAHELKDAAIHAPVPTVQDTEASSPAIAPEQSPAVPEGFEPHVSVPNIPSAPKVEAPSAEVLRPVPAETLQPLRAHVPESASPEIHLPHEASPEGHHPSVSPRESSSSLHLNAHGVDLEKPDVSVVGGKYFAHGGGSNQANYEVAVRFARDIARTEPGVPVYYVEERMTILGGLERTVRALVLDPQSGGGAGLVVPYSEGGTVIQMPPIPDPEDYEPVPTRR